MPRPKCIVFKKKDITEAQLKELAKTIPLAEDCLECDWRKNDILEKFCWKGI